MNKTILDQMEYVYKHLEDEESKDIFQKRNLFYEDGDYRHINDIVDRYVPEFKGCGYYEGRERELFDLVLSAGKKIIIYGAGIRGRKLAEAFKKKNFSVSFYVDSNEKKIGTVIDGVEIISFEYFMSLQKKEDYFVIVSPVLGTKAIIEELKVRGIKDSNIIVENNYMDAFTDEQYFDKKIIKFADNEVFIDGGCCSFDTSKRFIELLSAKKVTFKKIYAFEPDPDNMLKCIENAEAMSVDMRKVEFIEAGLWSRETEIGFELNGDGTSRIIRDVEKNANKVRVKTIDDVVKEKVTFIKMDIEGAELEALYGAKETILKYKPKLAICVYHKREDMWEIPYYIKKLMPEYKLYMRHYGNYIYETVIYAVCD